MERFTNILAVYNDVLGSEDVLAQAVALARADKARLTVVNPLGEHPQSPLAVEEAKRRLARIGPCIAQEGATEIATGVLVGTPHVEITRQVLLEEHDLVLASAQGGGAIKNVFLGNTAINLMRKCPCPVWLLKPSQTVPCSRIMAAIDDPTDQTRRGAINTKILDLAMSLARAQNASLHVVHSWDVNGSEGEMLRSEIRDSTKQCILDKHESQRKEALIKLLARYPTSELNHKLHLPRGRPQPNIVELANKLDIDLVVMGTTSRVGIPGLLMGNSAETVLDMVRCGVLTIKPDGFRTPVAIPEMGPMQVSTGRH